VVETDGGITTEIEFDVDGATTTEMEFEIDGDRGTAATEDEPEIEIVPLREARDLEIEIEPEVEGETNEAEKEPVILFEFEIEIVAEIEIEFEADTCPFTIETPTSKIVRRKKSFIFSESVVCVVFV